jgi:hypothetical protein
MLLLWNMGYSFDIDIMPFRGEKVVIAHARLVTLQRAETLNVN